MDCKMKEPENKIEAPKTAAEKIAVFAGSFDPFTIGHLDIVERAASMFDELWVLLAVNASKKYMLSQDVRLELVRRAVAHLPNVKVAAFDGLTVDFMKSVGAKFLVRGIRTGADLDYEQTVSWNNKILYPECETVLLSSAQEHLAISSTVVREILKCGVAHNKNGRDVLAKFVPAGQIDLLLENYGK